MSRRKPSPDADDDPQRRTQVAVEGALDQIKTPAQAERAAARLTAAAGDLTCAQAGELLTATPVGATPAQAADAVAGSPKAQTLVQTAAQLQGADPEARKVLSEAVFQAANPQTDTARSPRRVLARTLLRRALLRRLQPLDSLDAALFMRVNRLPHPPLANAAMHLLSAVTKGSNGQVLALAVFALLRPRWGGRALLDVVPPLWLATATVEYPVKRYFRRQRPFLAEILAVVIGRRPGSFSFPSGHTAAAFAFATLMRRHGSPRTTTGLLALATAVGFSRVYLGAHYPGDVLTGAVGGTLLAGGFRRVTGALWGRLAGRFRRSLPVTAPRRRRRWGWGA